THRSDRYLRVPLCAPRWGHQVKIRRAIATRARCKPPPPVLRLFHRRTGLAMKPVLKSRPAISMLPCPGISSEVGPKSPHPRVFGPLLPPVPRVQDNVIIKGGTPHGFEALRRWVALFGDRAAVKRFVCGAWDGGVCEDHRRQVHGQVPRIWLR